VGSAFAGTPAGRLPGRPGAGPATVPGLLMRSTAVPRGLRSGPGSGPGPPIVQPGGAARLNRHAGGGM